MYGYKYVACKPSQVHTKSKKLKENCIILIVCVEVLFTILIYCVNQDDITESYEIY